MKYKELIDKLTIEEKVALTSGKDFWQSYGVDRDDVKIPSIFLSDGPHGIRKQAAAADHPLCPGCSSPPANTGMALCRESRT